MRNAGPTNRFAAPRSAIAMQGALPAARATSRCGVALTMWKPKSRQKRSVGANSRFSQRRNASSTARPTAGGRRSGCTPGGSRLSRYDSGCRSTDLLLTMAGVSMLDLWVGLVMMTLVSS
jgi:hypothetical protein